MTWPVHSGRQLTAITVHIFYHSWEQHSSRSDHGGVEVRGVWIWWSLKTWVSRSNLLKLTLDGWFRTMRALAEPNANTYRCVLSIGCRRLSNVSIVALSPTNMGVLGGASMPDVPVGLVMILTNLSERPAYKNGTFRRGYTCNPTCNPASRWQMGDLRANNSLYVLVIIGSLGGWLKVWMLFSLGLQIVGSARLRRDFPHNSGCLTRQRNSCSKHFIVRGGSYRNSHVDESQSATLFARMVLLQASKKIPMLYAISCTA